MRILVNGRHMQLTGAIKDYVTEKFSRLTGHFDFIQEVHVFLSVVKNPSVSQNQIAEATIHVNGSVLRVASASESLYASIDLLVDKTHRSLQRHKTKLLHRAKSGHGGESIRRAVELEEPPHAEEEDAEELFFTFEEEAKAVEAPARTPEPTRP